MLEDFRLKVFMAVEREGNFTRAASNLGISQPAVSQNIAELEKETGTELFYRKKGSVSLTPAGTAFKEYAARILHWYSAAEEMFGQAGKLRSSAPVIIASDEFVAGSLLPKVLETMVSMNPGLSFKIVTDVSLSDPDITVVLRPHSDSMTLEEGNTYVRSFDAVAVPEDNGNRLAVWTPYLRMLPFDIAPRVFLDSTSVSLLRGLSSPEITIIIPKDAANPGLSSREQDLPFLKMDIHAIPSDSFKGSEIFKAFKNLLKENL